MVQINEDKLGKLNINQYLTLLKIYYKYLGKSLNYSIDSSDLNSLVDNKYLEYKESSYKITKKGLYILDIKGRDYNRLAEGLREIYPKGNKDYKWAWKAPVKEVVKRLKKMDDLYGTLEYSNDTIIKVVSNYINGFNSPSYNGMQLLKYLILKEKEGSMTSTLAGLLDSNKDMREMRIIDVDEQIIIE